MIIDLIKKNIPQYNTKLPISKKNISFRPLLVKEEKFISIVTNINSTFEDKIKNLAALINSCCDDKVNCLNLYVPDFQFLLNEIRKKSVSESVSLNITCPITNENISIETNLNDFKCSQKKSNFTLKVNDNLIIKFDQPKVSDLLSLRDYPETDEDYFDLMCRCLSTIETPEEKINLTDSDKKNAPQYIELLKMEDYIKIKNFIFSGNISTTFKYQTSDGIEREIEVNDISNFLKFYSVILML